MKTILVSTDFSDAAKNAADYAVELAKVTGSKLVLFNSYHLPVPATEVPLVLDYRDLEGENIALLEKEKKRMDPKGVLSVELSVLPGFAVDNLIEVENSCKPDLIIMGMRGAGKVSEYLLGSITTSFITRTASPVLVIPEGVKFRVPARITFACDYDIDPTSDVLLPLQKFIRQFNSHLLILNIFKKDDVVDKDKAVAGVLLENHMKGLEHSFYFVEETEFVKDVNDFSDKHEADMIVLMPHHHRFFENIFKESHTKKLAFHSHLPVLTIPECNKTK